MGHRLRSWTAITSRDVLQIELWAGAVSTADATRSQRLFDDLLFAAYGDGDERARDVVQRIFRAAERRDPPEDGALAPDREIRDALADEIARGHLRVIVEPRPNIVPRPASDDLMPLSDGPEPPEPLPPPTTWFSIRVVDEVGDPDAQPRRSIHDSVRRMKSTCVGNSLRNASSVSNHANRSSSG